MENRKTTFVKLEVYEDKAEEFKALLHLLKSVLNDFGFEQTRENYYDPVVFDTHIKNYFEFLKYLVEMVHIPSINGEDPVPSIDLMSVPESYEFKRYQAPIQFGNELKENIESTINLNEYGTPIFLLESPLYPTVMKFIKESKGLPYLSDSLKMEKFAAFIIHFATNIKRKSYAVDEFWRAAASYTPNSESKLPHDLYRLITMHQMFGYRLDAHTIQGKKSKRDDYQLVHRIHEMLIDNFPELKESPHQAHVFTGYTCHFLGVFDDIETFKENSSGGKNWREYLAANVKNHLVK